MSLERNYRQRVFKRYVTSKMYTEPRSGVKQESMRILYEGYWGKFLPEDKDASILDVGCGSGDFLAFLQSKGYRNALGIDISPEQVGEAYDREARNIVEGDALSYLRLRQAEYDLIVTLSFLEHLTKNEIFDFLDAACVALKPGGRLFCMVPNAKGPFGGKAVFGDITHELVFTPESILQVAAIAGLRLRYIGECGPIPHGFISTIRWVIWQAIRGLILLAMLAEGADFKYPVYTIAMRLVLENQNTLAVPARPCP